MDYNSGKVIEEKNKDLVRSVASISKLMTAYVAINYCDNINDVVVIGDEIDKAYGSAVYIQKGEELTLKELLYALLLRSGNDAALSIASFIGQGDISFFVSMMNQEARKIGMHNSLFRNPCGLDEEDGKRYHHILDARTGYPADSGLMSVTVIGEDSTLCDALSTVGFILGLDEGMELLNNYNVMAIFVDNQKNVYYNDKSILNFLSFEGESEGYILMPYEG